mmetsp:Transcript_5122/g.12256  ORF Transcript_5122/g.12256 Transcript_5122/m.12256 type:complete len:105 (-) Transcript_5122:182-496(-)
MKQLGERWGDDLMILAFPSMEFGGQEFPDDEDIQAFAEKQGFPGVLLKLGNVLGSDAPKVWKYFMSETGADDPDWNFQGKFLVDKDGKVCVPDDLESDIAALMS